MVNLNVVIRFFQFYCKIKIKINIRGAHVFKTFAFELKLNHEKYKNHLKKYKYSKIDV